jgi:16S rRNA G527 N7-methylase RsmG
MEVGLIINEKKTKYLKCTKKDTRTENLNINNLHIEQVQPYRYLGSIIRVTQLKKRSKRG